MMKSSGMVTARAPTANARRFRNARILVITDSSIFCGEVYTRSPGLYVSFATFYNCQMSAEFRFWDSSFPQAHTSAQEVSLNLPIKLTDFITYQMTADWRANW